MKTIILTIVFTLALLTSYSQCDIDLKTSKRVFNQINTLRVKIGKDALKWDERSLAKATKKVCNQFTKDIRKIWCQVPIENLAYNVFNEKKYDWGVDGAIAIINYRGEYYYYFIVE